MNTGKPEHLRKLSQPLEPETDMVVRQACDSHRLPEPRCDTDVSCAAFKKCAPTLYNRLPSEVRSSGSVHVFKKRLKTFLLRVLWLTRKCITENYVLWKSMVNLKNWYLENIISYFILCGFMFMLSIVKSNFG